MEDKDETIKRLQEECVRWQMRAGIALGLASKHGGVPALREYSILLNELENPPREWK